jgi:hypothetical protein
MLNPFLGSLCSPPPQLAENFEGASYIASSIVPGCVTAINSLLPILIEMITKFESWDSEKTVIKVLLVKMYLAKILNVLIQFASYLLLADPVFFSSSSNKFFGFDTGDENLARATIRTNVEVQFTPETFNCRLDQVAAGLLQVRRDKDQGGCARRHYVIKRARQRGT